MKYYKNKKIIFRFDIGNFDGFGHYKRSSAFIEFLIKKKFSVTICTNRPSIKFLNKKFKKKVFVKKSKENEEKFLNRVSKTFEGNIIIIDKIYSYKKNSIENLKKKNDVIFFQNNSVGSKIADKVIFPDDHTKKFTSDKRYFFGSKYLAVRDEILRIKKVRSYNYLGINFGGSDPFGITIKVAKILKKLEWDKKTIFFIGKDFKDKKKLSFLIKDIKNFYIKKFDIKSLFESKLLITSFSIITYEISHLSKLNLVITLNKTIKLPKTKFLKNVINLGFYKNLSNNLIYKNLNKYWNLERKKLNYRIKTNANKKLLDILKN
tara:strand:+ start:10301 stop:11260 length:960 start_codon:yes stop_codon:yes gene_type:complete